MSTKSPVVDWLRTWKVKGGLWDEGERDTKRGVAAIRNDGSEAMRAATRRLT